MRTAAIMQGGGITEDMTHYLMIEIPMYALFPVEKCIYKDIDYELEEDKLRYLAQFALEEFRQCRIRNWHIAPSYP